MKHRTIIIISIIVAVACIIIGFFNAGTTRLVFAAVAAAAMTFALIYDVQTRKKER